MPEPGLKGLLNESGDWPEVCVALGWKVTESMTSLPEIFTLFSDSGDGAEL